MKKVILGVGLVALVAVLGALAYMAYAAPSASNFKEGDEMEYLNHMFENFMVKHNKYYFNDEEKDFRRQIYIQRLIEVYEHNMSGASWQKGINRFSDLTDEEFRRMYLGYRKSDIEAPVLEFDETEELESSVDWKKKGAVAAVKDQGNCGSCWAFSTVAGTEGAHYLKHGKLVTFSEQQLVDCATSKYGNYGCDGGDLPGSFKYFAAKGAQTESAYPYKARDRSCNYDKSSVKTTVSKYNMVKTYSDSALTSALNKQPLAVCIDASALMSYSSGVISLNACGKRPQLDHCVLLYGYASNYWMLKNSWGTNWGERGFFRFEKGGNTCGIQEEAMTVSVQ